MSNSSSDRRAALRGVPFFAELAEDSLDLLIEHSRSLTLRKNTILMSEGETGESMYIVIAGSIRVFVSDEEGNEIVLFLEGPGSYLGEISLLDDEPRTASAITLEKTEVLAISKAGFLACLERNPETAFLIVRTMTDRLRRATRTIRSLALDNVYQRLASKFRELAQAGEDGCRRMPRKFSNQELGEMIGASREMVGKIVNDLAKGGYIEQVDRRWCLLKELPDNW